MRKISIILILVVFVFCFSNYAFGWSQWFVYEDVGNYNQLGVWWLSGDKFGNPVLSDFTIVGWNNYNFSNTNAYAFGPTTTSMGFYLNFESVNPTDTDFLMMSSLDNTVKFRQHITYSNGSWAFAPEDYPIMSDADWYELGGGDPIQEPSPIPEPTGLLLFGIGVFGFYKVRKKRLKKL